MFYADATDLPTGLVATMNVIEADREVSPIEEVIRTVTECRVLILDDAVVNCQMLEMFLRQDGFRNVRSHTDSLQALDLFRDFRPDILLLDLHMPDLDGIEVMSMIRSELPPSHYLPIVILTGDGERKSREESLAHGATDFLTKPYDPVEVLLRIRNLLQIRLLHQQLYHEKEALDERVRERTRTLDESRLEVLERLARAAEFRDDDTCQHTQRVGRNSGTLARLLGLPEATVDLIERAAPLHDIGKIGIPDAILRKKGKLTPEEFEVMRSHTLIGGQILENGRSPLIRMAEQIALTHHEMWDGSGYPVGLERHAIPLAGRIVTVVDVFDALTHERSYKKAWSTEQAIEWILKHSGTLYDPEVVEIFRSGVEFDKYEI